ncbi:4-diphosphocytidyl-2-C-methyl-D-erythritol kinase [Candidatus Magnetomoraceae bacterium gMMP-1]
MKKILSPAKINLFLHVTGKRTDGYHELFSLMCCINLYDTLSLNFKAPEIRVECSHPGVPENKSNTAYRAAELFLKTIGEKSGLYISIDKKIPVAAGLGGGSSNAATVLMELNKYYKEPLSQKELMTMGLRIGADVPFFIFKKPALACGIGERLEHFNKKFNFSLVLIYPGFEVSTGEIYKKLNLELTNSKKQLKYSFGKYNGLDCSSLHNDLEPIALSEYPKILSAKKALLNYNPEAALMSGSGSTVFGLFKTPDDAVKACKELSVYKEWQVFDVEILN